MMELGQIRDYIKTANLAENYYIGKLDSKKEKSIGVYQLKKHNDYERAVGAEENDRIKHKGISVLIHWSKNAAETERTAYTLYEFLKRTKPKKTIGEYEISYIQMLQNEPVDVSTDDFGIYERVIEFIVHYKKI
jgi:hypothetical protein